MRSRAQIKTQLRQVTFRHLQRRLRENFRVAPETCAYNGEALEDGPSLRLCRHTDGTGRPRNVVCDSRVPGCSEVARGCPLWSPLATKEAIREGFQKMLEPDQRGILAQTYPDIVALLWVLDEADQESSTELPLEDVKPEEPAPRSLFARLWRALF